MKRDKRRKAELPNRDSRGRFFPAGQMDAEQKLDQRDIEEQNKLGPLYLELCKKIGQPELARHFNIKQYPETGNWSKGYGTLSFFNTFIAGILFGRQESKDKVLAIANLIKEAATIEDKISQINEERERLIKEQINA